MSADIHIERRADGFYVRVETDGTVGLHGPFATFEAASECLEQLRAALEATAKFQRPYDLAIRKHKALFKRRTPDRAARIREELAGFRPPAPPTTTPSTAWPPRPPAAPTTESVRAWQAEARTAANRYRRAKAAKQRQGAATAAARPVKAAKATVTEHSIKECWRAAADVPERRRAAHVAKLLGVTPQHVRRVLRRN